MNVSLDPGLGELALGLADRNEARDFFATAKREGGFLVALAAELRFRDSLQVVVRTDDGFELAFDGEVSGVSATRSGEYATAILLTGWGLAQNEQLAAALAGAARQRPPASQRRAKRPPLTAKRPPRTR